MPYNENDIISIPSDIPQLSKLISELSQPTYEINMTGKIVVNKTPDGMKSPNMADAVNMLYSPLKTSAWDNYQ